MEKKKKKPFKTAPLPVKKTAQKKQAKAIVKSKASPTPSRGAKGLKQVVKVVFTKPEPPPKGLYSLEFTINSSPDVLFDFISTPGGLENWFADRVYIIEGNFVFNWENGEKRLAKQVAVKDKESARYHWLDEPGKKYFEFRIQIDDLTSDVALIVSDFADNQAELEESSRLWHSQVHDLHHAIGSS